MHKILEERRKAMLRVMLIGVIIAISVALSRDLFDYIKTPETFTNGFMIPLNLSVIGLSLFLIAISKRLPSWASALIWLSFTLIVITFADTPEELVAGKSSLAWVLVLLPAPFIADRRASFITAGATTVVVGWLTIRAYGQLWPGLNLYFLAMLWLIALLVWLASKNMTEAIESSFTEQERLSAILENVADGIVVLGREGEMLRANPSALNMLDGQIEAFVTPPEDTEVKVPDGRIVSLSWAIVPDVGRVAVVRDVTREIEVARMKDALLAVVSHELRTPLAGITGAAEVLTATGVENPDLIPTFIEIIQRNSVRLLRLVDDLLDRAQLESGKFSLVITPFSPDDLRKEARDLLAQHSESTSVNLSMSFRTNGDEPILGDLGRISQIMRNLIDNAVKFTQEGDVDVNIEIEDALIMLKVRDTGMGIPAQQLPDIFEPFRRASDYATRRTQGVGLGLSIVHALVQQMNGQIEVDSKINEGTTFRVSLPLEIANE